MRLIKGAKAMNLEECYQKIGGNYAEICARIPSVGIIEKFIAMFPKDESFHNLCVGIRNGNREETFRAVHTLKGICQNLCLGNLLACSQKLTEAIRTEAPGFPENAAKLFEDVKQSYEDTVSVIRMYLNEQKK